MVTRVIIPVWLAILEIRRTELFGPSRVMLQPTLHYSGGRVSQGVRTLVQFRWKGSKLGNKIRLNGILLL